MPTVEYDRTGRLTGKHGAGRHMRSLQAGPFFVSETVHRSGLRLESHSHDNACLHYIIRGAYAESTASGSQVVPAGNALLKPAHLPHWNNFAREACSLRIEFPETVPAQRAVGLPTELIVISGARLAQTCSEILDEFERDDEYTCLAVEGLCVELLALSLRSASGPSPRLSRPPHFVEHCEAILREQYRERLRFDAIARQLGVSRTHLATAFRTHRGCTMGAFVRRLRVDYVKGLLRSTCLPMVEIALAAGFSNQSHCTRVFHDQTGLPPVEWRSRLAS